MRVLTNSSLFEAAGTYLYHIYAVTVHDKDTIAQAFRLKQSMLRGVFVRPDTGFTVGDESEDPEPRVVIQPLDLVVMSR